MSTSIESCNPPTHLVRHPPSQCHWLFIYRLSPPLNLNFVDSRFKWASRALYKFTQRGRRLAKLSLATRCLFFCCCSFCCRWHWLLCFIPNREAAGFLYCPQSTNCSANSLLHPLLSSLTETAMKYLEKPSTDGSHSQSFVFHVRKEREEVGETITTLVVLLF